MKPYDIPKFRIGDRLTWDGVPTGQKENVGVVVECEWRSKEEPEKSGWYYKMDTPGNPWIWEELLRKVKE